MATLGTCRTCKGVVSNEATKCPHCGQPSPYHGDGMSEVQALIRQHRRVEAIKKLREIRPSLGHKQTKDILDAIERNA